MTDVFFRLGIPMKGVPAPDSLERIRLILARALANKDITLTLDCTGIAGDLQSKRIAAAEKAQSLHQLGLGRRWLSKGPWDSAEDENVLRRTAIVTDAGDAMLLCTFVVSFVAEQDSIGDAGCFTASEREIGENPFSSRR